MAGQEDREPLFPVSQIIGNEFLRLVDAIGYGIAMGVELGRGPLQAAIVTEIGFQRFVQTGPVAFIISQQGSQGPVVEDAQHLVIGLGKEEGIGTEGSEIAPGLLMETGPYQSLLPLAAAVWQGFQVRRRQALARHQAVMAFEPGDECCRQRSLQEQDDCVLIRKYKVWLVQPVEEGLAVSQKIGIAIGAGTDVAIESADAVLMKSDLLDAVSAIRLSKAVLKNIKENLFWALIYNVICIPLAAGILYPAFGIKLSPVIGAAAMSMSSVCVVMNALRLRFFKPDHGASAKIEAGQTAAAVSTDRHEEKAATQAAEEQPVQEKEAIRMEKILKIEGMMCAHCQKHVHDALAKMDGVTDVTVDLEGGKADVKATHDISEADFRKVIEEAGYELVG